MRNGYIDGKYYRARAEECRTIAETYLDADARKVMLRIASDYQRMAECTDQLESDIAELAELAKFASVDSCDSKSNFPPGRFRRRGDLS